MDPDGSNNTLEFIDTLATWDSPVLFFAWSPDGRSVAWQRNLHTQQTEIVIHELASHSERILLSVKTSIADLSWTTNNYIIYALRTSDDRNLWMLPVTGGTPVQITKGLGRVAWPRVSADGRSVIFLQSKEIGHLWLAKLDGSGE